MGCDGDGRGLDDRWEGKSKGGGRMDAAAGRFAGDGGGGGDWG